MAVLFLSGTLLCFASCVGTPTEAGTPVNPSGISHHVTPAPVATSSRPQYRIGVSQCSDDAWRTKMNEEMARELIFHPEITMRIRQAQDNSDLQCAQIDSFIRERVDLLIVSPNEAEEVKPAVSRAYDAGIPVIVADRQVSGERYTAFIGGDNYAVGEHMGRYALSLAERLGHTPRRPLRAFVVTGLPGSTPMTLRQRGLTAVLTGHPEVQVVGTACGDWFRAEARIAVDSLLTRHGEVDVILAQNDEMAMGASEACRKRNPNRRPYIMGADGIVGAGGGVEALLRGDIDVTATYPSKGDFVIETAAHILHGEPYRRDVVLQTILIDRDAAEPLQQVAEEIDRQMEAIAMLERQLTHLGGVAHSQQVTIAVLVAFFLLAAILGLVLVQVRAYRLRVRQEREEQSRLVAKQQQQLESITAELERTRQSQSLDEVFISRLQSQIEKHLGDTEFTVESLCSELGMSRTQLFRRTKQLTGVSPVELIRQVRLRRAQQMLRNTDLTIQQVAYSVGFSSPSYFTKCYKDFFGTTPKGNV